MSRKYDVILKYGYLGSGSNIDSLNCGSLAEYKITQYLHELTSNKLVPNDSCVRHFSAKFVNKYSAEVSLSRNYNYPCPNAPREKKSADFIICMTNMNNCKCAERDCLNNIKNGKCVDPFVIENIGKKFFADKYKENNQKQR